MLSNSIQYVTSLGPFDGSSVYLTETDTGPGKGQDYLFRKVVQGTAVRFKTTD